MAKVTSNADAVGKALGSVVSSLGFHGAGRYRPTLGEDVQDLIAEAVFDQTVLGQRDPSGSPLARLARSTVLKKIARGYPETILVETGEMLSTEQLKGTARVSRTSMEVTYGKTASAKQKAEYAHRGFHNRPERPFYELDAKGKVDLRELIVEGLDRQVHGEGR